MKTIPAKITTKDINLLKTLISPEFYEEGSHKTIGNHVKEEGLDNHSVTVLTLLKSMTDISETMLRPENDPKRIELLESQKVLENTPTIWQSKVVLQAPLEDVEEHLHNIGLIMYIEPFTKRYYEAFSKMEFKNSLASLQLSKKDIELVLVALMTNVKINENVEDILLKLITEVKDVYLESTDAEEVGLRTLLGMTRLYIISKL